MNAKHIACRHIMLRHKLTSVHAVLKPVKNRKYFQNNIIYNPVGK